MTEQGGLNADQLSCLLADFSAIKAEIARRSTLQRAVLAGYLAVVALVFQQSVSVGLTRLWVLAIWTSAALAFQFYVREGLEIDRLATLIRERVAITASGLTGASPEQLFPSETNPEVPRTLALRVSYDRQFNWAVFFLVPLGVSVVFFVTRFEHARAIIDPLSRAMFAGLFIVVAAFRCGQLLMRHAWPPIRYGA